MLSCMVNTMMDNLDSFEACTIDLAKKVGI
jgi:hypothetical protein